MATTKGKVFESTIEASSTNFSEPIEAGDEDLTLITITNESAEDLTATYQGEVVVEDLWVAVPILVGGIEVTDFPVAAGETKVATMDTPWPKLRVKIEADAGATESGNVTVQYATKNSKNWD